MKAPADSGTMTRRLIRLQEGTERIPTEFTSESFALAGSRTILGILAQPDHQSRSGSLQVVRLCVDLFLRFRRGRPPGFQRSLPGERQGGCGATAQGNLLAHRVMQNETAGPPHPGPLDLSRAGTTKRQSTSFATPSRWNYLVNGKSGRRVNASRRMGMCLRSRILNSRPGPSRRSPGETNARPVLPGTHHRRTAGALRLTSIIAPQGLQADGETSR